MPTPRYYVDADSLGLARILIQVRPDVTFPGDDGRRARFPDLPACSIVETATPDDDWIPRVAAEGLTIITRDRRIQSRSAEATAVFTSGAKMFAISSPGSLNL